MKKKIYLEEEIIQSPHYPNEKNTDILVISDLHYHDNDDPTWYILLMDEIIKQNPDYIIMPGDIFDTNLNSTKSKQFFERFIRCITEVCPVIAIAGNHDIASFDTKSFFSRKYGKNEKALSYLRFLSTIPNFYYLDNEQLQLGDLFIYGLNPRYETYLKYRDRRTEDLFIEDYLKCNFHISEGNYNILLNHSPHLLCNERVCQAISDFKLFDLGIAGHEHDGYLPKILDPYLKNTDVGLFFMPLVFPVPGAPCRGVREFGRGYLFISQGFAKWNSGICSIVNGITEHDIERVKIMKKSL
ncbi:MAG: metallophosphoesterase [Bacilli bacterium]|nr:metallophosphoesterase [Bacilli bacterium]